MTDAADCRVDWASLERDCQKRWSDSALFEAEPDDSRPKKFVTVAYPYPNSPQHVGHGRTYTLADVHARFWRLLGYNVLFPMGFHYTGTPILGMARRVQDRDAELVRNLRDIYGVAESDIDKFADPLEIARYFHREIRSGMVEMGYSIDWRREFTTIDPAYSRFIEWQISTLKRKGLIMRGSHPVGWCPKDQNPVSQHDTLGDVEPAFTEYVMIAFRTDDGYALPVATLRPETIFGVTNLWVDPDTTYDIVTLSADDDTRWIVSHECAYKLGFLGKDVAHRGVIAGRDLVGMRAKVPHASGRCVPILPAQFVEPGTGTGIVMSVPAHAPYDWQALQDLAAGNGKHGDAAGGGGGDDRAKDGGRDSGRDSGRAPHASPAVRRMASGIEPISIIMTEGYGRVPAEDAVSAAAPDCAGQLDPRLESATRELYSKEFYAGVMADGEHTAQFGGKPVREAKDSVGAWLADSGYAEQLLEIADAPVRCRCGTECVVKVLSDQWFLDYGDKEWKESAHRCFDGMSILPDEMRQEFGHVVDWLHERACARQHGLGTRLPWDENWIVESLSDSVIYMAYYVLSRFVNDGTIKPEQMTPEFFDCVLLGIWGDGGDPAGSDSRADTAAVARWRAECGIPEQTLRSIWREFEYFYPVDYRHSGRDLVPNHLTFFVMNHVAIFKESAWPRGIVVNGSVLMDGSKMSKSMGNIIPLRKAIREFGADPIRLAIIISAELLQDADFDMESVHGMRAKLESMHSECARLGTYAAVRSSHHGDGDGIGDGAAAFAETAAVGAPAEDRWLFSRVHQIVSDVRDAMERMRLREALHLILFEMESVLSWHARRAAAKGRADSDVWHVLHRVMSVRVIMLQPFAPHITESMWESLGYGFDARSKNRWPGSESGMMAGASADKSTLQAEDLLRSTLDDIASILKVTKISPSKIAVYVADDVGGDDNGGNRTDAVAAAAAAGSAAKPISKRVIYRAILGAVVRGDASMGPVMKSLLADPSTSSARQVPDFVQKALKDILSEPVPVREARLASPDFEESKFLAAELPGLVRAAFGAELEVFSESDPGIYDPKSKARHARPFKPAILVE